MTANQEQGTDSNSGGSLQEAPRCANCGVDIPWAPAMHRGETYCCGGCAQGGPCYCSYDLTTFDWLYPATRRDQPAGAPAAAPAGTPRGAAASPASATSVPSTQGGRRGPGWS